MGSSNAFGWAATDTSGHLSPFHFSRRENEADDVTLKILFCGVCHSDLHTIKNDWGFTTYPVVPGTATLLVLLESESGTHITVESLPSLTISLSCLLFGHPRASARDFLSRFFFGFISSST